MLNTRMRKHMCDSSHSPVRSSFYINTDVSNSLLSTILFIGKCLMFWIGNGERQQNETHYFKSWLFYRSHCCWRYWSYLRVCFSRSSSNNKRSTIALFIIKWNYYSERKIKINWNGIRKMGKRDTNLVNKNQMEWSTNESVKIMSTKKKWEELEKS